MVLGAWNSNVFGICSPEGGMLTCKYERANAQAGIAIVVKDLA